MTSLVHGEKATEQVQSASQALFGRGDLAELDAGTVRDATAELPRAGFAIGAALVDLLVDSGLAPSRGGARRTVAEGGAYLNNVKVLDPEAVVGPEHLLHERYVVLRRGKKSLAAGVVQP